MKKIYLLTILFVCLGAIQTIAQSSFSFNCAKDTNVNCSTNCITLKTVIPDIHSSSSTYTVNPLTNAGGCFRPYIAPDGPGTSASLTIDDRYSAVINLPFSFPFFGANYNSVVISTNGLISFDATLATAFSHYGILDGGGFLTASSGTPLDLPSTLYDKALIMGPYHDLDPAYTTSSTQKIQYTVLGTAPYRRFIFSVYKVPLFDCSSLINNSQQIVLYETTGIVEVFVYSKDICTTWNDGRAMIGMQSMTRTSGIMAPGRKASDAPWGGASMNESWRFTPATGPSALKKVELFNTSGTLISTGVTTAGATGNLNVSFPNVCSTILGTTTYVVKSTYADIIIPTLDVIGTDTIRVIRSTVPVTANFAITNNKCNGSNTGSIVVSNPVGGIAPYTYSINGGAYGSNNTFNNLAAGAYTVSISYAGAICTKDTLINISQPAILATSVTSTTNATCASPFNGAINLNTTGGISPYTYSVDGTNFSSTLNALDSGTYTVTVKDANLCTKTISGVKVNFTNNLNLATRSDTTVCQTAPIVLTTSSNANAYTWTPASTLSSTTIASPTATPIATTAYNVVAQLGRCTKSATVNINVYPQPIVTLTPASATIIIGEQIQLNGVSANGIYVWSPTTGLNNTATLTPIAKPTTTGTTLYKLTTTNAIGCSAFATSAITVLPQCVIVKNAFTPNGDGINDTWNVYNQFDCLSNVEVHVYNRYGTKVFESSNYKNTWKGTYGGKSLPDGTYYGVVKFTLLTGRVYEVNTDITILR